MKRRRRLRQARRCRPAGWRRTEISCARQTQVSRATDLDLGETAGRNKANADREEAVDVLCALDGELKVAARLVGINCIGPPLESGSRRVVRPLSGVRGDVELQAVSKDNGIRRSQLAMRKPRRAIK